MSSQLSQKDIERLRKENAQLKAENNRLKQKAAKPASKKHSYSPLQIIRKVGVVLLVAFAVALLTAGNLIFWTGNTIIKQDRYVAATQPIIKDPVVQSTMALYTTNKIFDNVDVQGNIEQALPPKADFLAPQLAKQLRTGVQSTLQKVLANPKFQDKWNAVQAKQHDRLINFAAKYQGDDKISVNEVFAQLTQNLNNTKLAFLADKQLPPKVGEVTIVQASWLPVFHNVVTNIDTWRLLSIILLLVALAAAIWLSRRRRRIVYIFSLGSAGAMLATLLALHVVKSTVIDKTDSQYSQGIAHILQIVFHSLVIQTVTILIAMLLVWLIAWISGPSRQALLIKNQVGLLFGGKLHQTIFAKENKYTAWVQKHKTLLQWLVVGTVAVIMLLVRLTILGLVLYLLLIVVLDLAIEVVSGSPLTKRS
jgi:hypothetical protein